MRRGLASKLRPRSLTHPRRWRGWPVELWLACRREQDPLEFAFYEERVQQLLVSARQQRAAVQKGLLAPPLHLVARLWRRVYQPIHYFRYSPRIVSMAVVAAFLLFEVTVNWSTGSYLGLRPMHTRQTRTPAQLDTFLMCGGCFCFLALCQRWMSLPSSCTFFWTGCIAKPLGWACPQRSSSAR